MARQGIDQATRRLRENGGRAAVASALWDRLQRGPQGLEITADQAAQYRRWVNSWILDDVAGLIPELRHKLDTLGYVKEQERRR